MLVRTGQILACYGVQNASSPAWCMGGGAGCHAYPVNWFTGWLHGVGSGEQGMLLQVLLGCVCTLMCLAALRVFQATPTRSSTSRCSMRRSAGGCAWPRP